MADWLRSSPNVDLYSRYRWERAHLRVFYSYGTRHVPIYALPLRHVYRRGIIHNCLTQSKHEDVIALLEDAANWTAVFKSRKKQQAPLSEGNRAAIALLRSWRAVDPQEQQEQKETWEFLKQALEEDRL